ncbi:MAG: chemotaxis protein CheX [Acidobacteriota bacterium]|nr:chemotaxis protein CheX [Acidobacteriota bacterium]
MSFSENAHPGAGTAFDRGTWTPILGLATREVFEIMLGTSLQDPSAAKDERRMEFTALVGLAGSLCGVLSIRCSNASARIMASKMLGMPPDQVDNDCLDALGEIANMIAGNFKGKLSGVGNHCMLSVPTIIVGSDYHTHSVADGNSIEANFEFEQLPMCVTLEMHE